MREHAMCLACRQKWQGACPLCRADKDRSSLSLHFEQDTPTLINHAIMDAGEKLVRELEDRSILCTSNNTSPTSFVVYDQLEYFLMCLLLHQHKKLALLTSEGGTTLAIGESEMPDQLDYFCKILVLGQLNDLRKTKPCNFDRGQAMDFLTQMDNLLKEKELYKTKTALVLDDVFRQQHPDIEQLHTYGFLPFFIPDHPPYLKRCNLVALLVMAHRDFSVEGFPPDKLTQLKDLLLKARSEDGYTVERMRIGEPTNFCIKQEQFDLWGEWVFKIQLFSDNNEDEMTYLVHDTGEVKRESAMPR